MSNSRLTQSDIILNHLLTGERISTWIAYERYHITVLSQRISDLRQSGIPIQSVLVKTDGKQYSEYWLSEQDIELMKEVSYEGA